MVNYWWKTFLLFQYQQVQESTNDVLSLFKVGSAKQWKELSKNLVINVQEDEEEEEDRVQGTWICWLSTSSMYHIMFSSNLADSFFSLNLMWNGIDNQGWIFRWGWVTAEAIDSLKFQTHQGTTTQATMLENQTVSSVLHNILYLHIVWPCSRY